MFPFNSSRSLGWRIGYHLLIYAVLLVFVASSTAPIAFGQLGAAVAPPPYLDQWGRLGSGNGLLRTPAGVAVASNGTVYVADTYNHRIQQFTSSGAYVTQWGSEGSGNGQFSLPRGVAVDSNGTVYVADTNNHRIQQFTSSGAYVTQWGSQGSGDGQFISPSGVAVASNGTVYVADANNHRIQQFDSSGAYLAQWGSNGSGDGQFNNPAGVAVASNGNVYVADTVNNRIQQFDSSGAYLAQWGSNGSGDGQFISPQGVAVDSNGTVYVADVNSHRIQQFNSSGAYLTKWGSGGSGNGQFRYPRGVAVDSNGTVYVADSNNHRIQRFGTATSTPEIDVQGNGVSIANGDTTPSTADHTDFGSVAVGNAVTHTFTISNSGSADLTGVAVSVNGANAYTVVSQPAATVGAGLTTGFALRFAPTVSGTLTATVSIANDDSDENPYTFVVAGAAVAPPPYLDQWGRLGSANGLLRTPAGVAVASNGTVYVADTGNHRIQQFDSSGAYVTQWGSLGSGNGQFNQPFRVAVASNGTVYVADVNNHRIQQFTSSGAYLTQWGSLGSGDGQFNFPRGVAVDSNGTVYVADTNNYRIQQFNSSGAYLTKWGSNGSGNGQFRLPRGVAVDSNGTVYVADTGNHRIQRFGTATSTPEIDVQGNGVSIANGDTTPSTADHTDFGSVAVGNAVTHTFTIGNSGTGALTLSGAPVVKVTGDSAFSVSTQPGSSSIAAGGSTTFQITFAPSAVGVVTATVSIANDDSDENPYTFVVQGAAVAQLNNTNQVSQQSFSALYNPGVQPCGTELLPTHTLTPTLVNNAADSYHGLYFVVTELRYTTVPTYTPTLCNADGGQGGAVAAQLTLADATLGDGLLAAGESFVQPFQVGLPVRARYRLFVNLYGVPDPVTAANATAGELVGTLGWEVDEDGTLVDSNVQLFLPLVAR